MEEQCRGLEWHLKGACRLSMTTVIHIDSYMQCPGSRAVMMGVFEKLIKCDMSFVYDRYQYGPN